MQDTSYTLKDFAKYNEIESITVHYTDSPTEHLQKFDKSENLISMFRNVNINKCIINKTKEYQYMIDVYARQFSEEENKYIRTASKRAYILDDKHKKYEYVDIFLKLFMPIFGFVMPIMFFTWLLSIFTENPIGINVMTGFLLTTLIWGAFIESRKY